MKNARQILLDKVKKYKASQVKKEKPKQYSERFVITDSGDWSVGIQGWSMDVDLILAQDFECESDRKEFTEAFKVFLLEWFSDIQTEVNTLGELEDIDAQYEMQAKLESEGDK